MVRTAFIYIACVRQRSHYIQPAIRESDDFMLYLVEKYDTRKTSTVSDPALQRCIRSSSGCSSRCPVKGVSIYL